MEGDCVLLGFYLLENFIQHLLFINFEIIEVFCIFFEVFFLHEKLVVMSTHEIHMRKRRFSCRFPLKKLGRFGLTLSNNDLVLFKPITWLNGAGVVGKIAGASLHLLRQLLLDLAAVSWD